MITVKSVVTTGGADACMGRVSRSRFPKQVLNLSHERDLLQPAVMRLQPLCGHKARLISRFKSSDIPLCDPRGQVNSGMVALDVAELYSASSRYTKETVLLLAACVKHRTS